MGIEQGVCQVREVREVREKSGNSLYPLKSQGKVREFSEKSGKSQGIFSDIKKSFSGNSKLKKKVSKFRYIPKISDFERIDTRKKNSKMSIESQGKLGKSQGKVGKSQGISCQKFGRHPDGEIG